MSSTSLTSLLSTAFFNPPKPQTPQNPLIISFTKTKKWVRNMSPHSAVGKKYKGTAMREKKLSEMIEKKVAEAMEACDGGEAMGSDGCRVAWDEVEEVSQAKADLRRRLAESDADPLESFCKENPETDECRVYDD